MLNFNPVKLNSYPAQKASFRAYQPESVETEIARNTGTAIKYQSRSNAIPDKQVANTLFLISTQISCGAVQKPEYQDLADAFRNEAISYDNRANN